MNDIDIKAILVMEESGSEHNAGDGTAYRRVEFAFRAVYVPAVDALAAKYVLTARRGWGPAPTIAQAATAEIVADYPTAVRRAVTLADEARAAAKAAAKKEEERSEWLDDMASGVWPDAVKV